MRNLKQRNAWTLVELMGVLVIMAVLFGLVAFVSTGLSDKRSPQRAADQMVGWLLQAKSRAARDKQAHGLRFVMSNANSMVTALEFIQLPEPYLPLRTVNSRPAFYTLTISRAANDSEALDVVVDGWVADPKELTIGDMLELAEGPPTQHVVTSVSPQTSPPLTRLKLRAGNGVPAAPGAVITMTNGGWRILRDVRPVIGEPLLMLPKDTGIDWLANQPPPTGYGHQLPRHILFAPDGGLIDCPAGRVVLWIRHAEDRGEPVLISISGRNSAISMHPIDTTKNSAGQMVNPFRFCDDGLGSGL